MGRPTTYHAPGLTEWIVNFETSSRTVTAMPHQHPVFQGNPAVISMQRQGVWQPPTVRVTDIFPQTVWFGDPPSTLFLKTQNADPSDWLTLDDVAVPTTFVPAHPDYGEGLTTVFDPSGMSGSTKFIFIKANTKDGQQSNGVYLSVTMRQPQVASARPYPAFVGDPPFLLFVETWYGRAGDLLVVDGTVVPSTFYAVHPVHGVEGLEWTTPYNPTAPADLLLSVRKPEGGPDAGWESPAMTYTIFSPARRGTMFSPQTRPMPTRPTPPSS